MAYNKYDSSLRTLWGYGASRITRREVSSIRKIFKRFKIDKSNSSWENSKEALRIEVSRSGAIDRSHVFNFIKLSRSKFLIFRQRLWLMNVQEGWTPIRYNWSWKENIAYYLKLAIEKKGRLGYSSAGDAIRSIKDGQW